MEREFFCATCGLFFWEEANYDNAFRIPMYHYACPECKSCNDVAGSSIWAVDTMGFAYFWENHVDFLPKSWSSKKYASEGVLKIYEGQGIEIR